MRYLDDKGGNIANAKASEDYPSLRDIVFNEMGDLIADSGDEVNYALNASGVNVGDSVEPKVLVDAIYDNGKKNKQMVKNLAYLLVRKNGIDTYQNDWGNIVSGVMEGVKGIAGTVGETIQSKRDPGAKTRQQLLDLIAQKQQNKHEAALVQSKSSTKTVLIIVGGLVTITVVIGGILWYNNYKRNAAAAGQTKAA